MGSEITESASLTAEHDVGPGLPCGTSRDREGQTDNNSLVAKRKSFHISFFILNSTSLGEKFS